MGGSVDHPPCKPKIIWSEFGTCIHNLSERLQNFFSKKKEWFPLSLTNTHFIWIDTRAVEVKVKMWCANKQFVIFITKHYRWLPGIVPSKVNLFNFFKATRSFPKLAYPSRMCSGSSSFKDIWKSPPPCTRKIMLHNIRELFQNSLHDANVPQTILSSSQSAFYKAQITF